MRASRRGRWSLRVCAYIFWAAENAALGQLLRTFLGDAALANAAPTADASATSSDSQHTVDQLTDADAATYWASSADSPVDVQLDFGSVTQIKAVEIDWERPAQAKRPCQKF